MNPPKRSIQTPARCQLLLERETLDLWKREAKRRGVPLVKLITLAMEREISGASADDAAPREDAP